MLGNRWKLKAAIAVFLVGPIVGVLLFVLLFIGTGAVTPPTCTSQASVGSPVGVGGAQWASQINHLYPRVMTGQPGQALPPEVIAALAESAGKTLGVDIPGWTMEQVTIGESALTPGRVQTISAPPDPGQGGALLAQGFGLWQITAGVGNDPKADQYGGFSQMLNPIKNALAMAAVFKSGGIGSWYGTSGVTDWHKHYTGALPLVNLNQLLGQAGGTTFVNNNQSSSCCPGTSTPVAQPISQGGIQTSATLYSGSSGSGGSLTGGYYFAELGDNTSLPASKQFASAHRLGDLFFQHKGAPPTLGGDSGTAQSLPYGAQVQVSTPSGQSLVLTKRDIGAGAPGASIDLTQASASKLGVTSTTQVTVKLISLHGGNGSGQAAGAGAGAGGGGTGQPVSQPVSGSGSGCSASNVSFVTGGYANPFPGGWIPNRLDMGYDGTFKGQIVAPVAGTILNSDTGGCGASSGWEGGYIAERADAAKIPGLASNVFYFAEGVIPTASSGTHVNAGQPIANAGPSGYGNPYGTGGNGQIEWGLSNATESASGACGTLVDSGFPNSRGMVLQFSQWAQRVLHLPPPSQTFHAGYA